VLVRHWQFPNSVRNLSQVVDNRHVNQTQDKSFSTTSRTI
jgi:hypothetical protein